MHGQEETSQAPRLVCTLLHAIFLGVAAWLYFGEGRTTVADLLGFKQTHLGNPARDLILFSFGVVLFSRMLLTLFYLLKRRFSWDELGGVLVALLTYQIGFALLARPTAAGLGGLDTFAIVLFLAGSSLNSVSELQRRRFKENPENRGRLYTKGLFRYARHINYFGDLLWVAGWALLTRNPWAILVPLALTAGFVFAFIPSLTRHLRVHYGKQYEEWARTTKALVPFIY